MPRGGVDGGFDRDIDRSPPVCRDGRLVVIDQLPKETPAWLQVPRSSIPKFTQAPAEGSLPLEVMPRSTEIGPKWS
jgi:hypothetical protein